MSSTKKSFYALALFAVALFAPQAAMATGPLTDALCAVVGWMTGGTGSAIATLAVIIIGVGALLGKVSWGMAIIVGLGIATIFGSAELMDALSGGGDNC